MIFLTSVTAMIHGVMDRALSEGEEPPAASPYDDPEEEERHPTMKHVTDFMSTTLVTYDRGTDTMRITGAPGDADKVRAILGKPDPDPDLLLGSRSQYRDVAADAISSFGPVSRISNSRENVVLPRKRTPNVTATYTLFSIDPPKRLDKRLVRLQVVVRKKVGNSRLSYILCSYYYHRDIMKDLSALAKELVGHQIEQQWLEFKHNTNEPSMIGERISAIANSVAMLGRSCGYIVWGVHDVSHEIVGTEFKPETQKVKGQELKNWLHNNLSDNAEFGFDETSVEGHRMVVLTIYASKQHPVAFQNIEYIRDGSYTKKLMDRPHMASRLWFALNSQSAEMMAAAEDCSPEDVRRLLAYDSFLTMLNLPDPTSEQSLMDLLIDNDVITKQDNGLYTVTVLGALLFAKDLSKFDRLWRKALRIVKYNGTSKSDIARQEQDVRGYAIGFEDNIRTLMLMLPSSEIITTGKAELKEQYSVVAIREILANAMIHQELGTSGMNLAIEVFSNRVEVSNPGPILVDKERLIDAAPRSRNERIAAMMRRVKLCEELGSGWDKIVESCERGMFPVPTVYSDDNGTRVVLSAPMPYANMSTEERLWNCYMHACSCFSKGGYLTNTSLRERFGLETNNSNTVQMSNLIREAKSKKLIKAIDETTSTRMFRYVPFWA